MFCGKKTLEGFFNLVQQKSTIRIWIFADLDPCQKIMNSVQERYPGSY
jgi:hypothetical protein